MLIKRTAYNEITGHLDKKEITLITGPRQAGKTTIMEAVRSELNLKGEKTLFLSLDFENDARHFESQSSLIQKISLEIGVSKTDRAFVFIDEIQRKENAGIFLKGLYDMNLPYKFIVSGSGSLGLKEKIHESLAGRKRIFEVGTLSFSEFVNFKTGYRYENKLQDYFRINAADAKKYLLEYINFGGYPRVALEDTALEKTKIINEIFQSYIEKDISYLLKVEKVDAFKNLIRILASQSGKLVNINELSSTLGISVPTVKNYLSYAEKTFIIRLMTPFYKNIRSEISKSPIVYFNDLGLRNFSVNMFGNITGFEQAGFTLQNFLYNTLREKYKYGSATIRFWRSKDGGEMDFVVEDGRIVLPIEVKSSELKKPAVSRSVKSFIERYDPPEVWIINLSLAGETAYKNTAIKFISVFENKKLPAARKRNL